MRKATAAALTGLLFLTAGAPAFAADGDRTDIDDITILATTDTHGTALNYNYFTGKPFGTPEEPKNLRGMDHLATAITEIRKDKGEDAVALLDNGDANQGSSLETVYKRDHAKGDVDPIATIYNHLDYDAGVVGNHEFNYGLDELQDYKGALDFPLLGANVTDKKTGKPYLEPYTFINKTTADGHDVKIAVIGVVTPGIPGWDGKKVESLNFGDQVEAVQKYVPEVKEKGADVVVVLAHTGLDPEGYEWKAADLQENAARSIAENTTGVDVVIGGHSHQTDQVQNYYTNKDGHEVLFTQPGYHGRFLSNITIPLSLDNDKVVVDWNEKEKPSAVAVKAADYAADPEIEKLISDWHEKTKKWVATVVAKATEDMPAATSAWEDTAILDFINYVQTEEIKRAMKGTKNE
ncbi:MAG: metallophosphoesterase, partial [Dermabacter sp.]|nr:metallophosphoesterase [Dermabacter sp.]